MPLRIAKRYYGPLLIPGQIMCISDQDPSLQSKLELKSAPNKGYGLFARVALAAGTLVISEPSIISIPMQENLPYIWSQYTALSDDRQNLYLGFHRENKPERDEPLCRKLIQRGYSESMVPLMVRVAAIFLANAFNVATEVTGNPVNRRSMFPTVARLNHSCLPNAHTYFNPETSLMDVHIIRDVNPGDELVISYFNTIASREQRQERAKAWGFSCECPACDTTHPSQPLHEQRRLKLAEIQLKVETGMVRNASEILHIMRQIREAIATDESLKPFWPYMAGLLGRVPWILDENRAQSDLAAEAQEEFSDQAARIQAMIVGTGSHADRLLREKLGRLSQPAAGSTGTSSFQR